MGVDGKNSNIELKSKSDLSKNRAEKVLSQLGVPMSTAIDMYLNQISLTGGIPFSVSLPKAPVSIHADAMTTEEIHQKLEKGYNDIAAGRVQNAAEAFTKLGRIIDMKHYTVEYK